MGEEWGIIPDGFDGRHAPPFSFEDGTGAIPAGSCYVYRGRDGNIDYTTPVALMGPSDTQVVIIAQDLPPRSIWSYVRREISECGLESESSPPCIIRIDANGDMIAEMPNVPGDLVAEPWPGGKARLRWRYVPDDEEIAPTGFNVYMDSGAGFDFSSPEGSVKYGRGYRAAYEWLSGQLTDGQSYRFVVRAYRTGLGETLNTNDVTVMIDGVGPAAITAGLIATWEAA